MQNASGCYVGTLTQYANYLTSKPQFSDTFDFHILNRCRVVLCRYFPSIRFLRHASHCKQYVLVLQTIYRQSCTTTEKAPTRALVEAFPVIVKSDCEVKPMDRLQHQYVHSGLDTFLGLVIVNVATIMFQCQYWTRPRKQRISARDAVARSATAARKYNKQGEIIKLKQITNDFFHRAQVCPCPLTILPLDPWPSSCLVHVRFTNLLLSIFQCLVSKERRWML